MQNKKVLSFFCYVYSVRHKILLPFIGAFDPKILNDYFKKVFMIRFFVINVNVKPKRTIKIKGK